MQQTTGPTPSASHQSAQPADMQADACNQGCGCTDQTGHGPYQQPAMGYAWPPHPGAGMESRQMPHPMAGGMPQGIFPGSPAAPGMSSHPGMQAAGGGYYGAPPYAGGPMHQTPPGMQPPEPGGMSESHACAGDHGPGHPKHDAHQYGQLMNLVGDLANGKASPSQVMDCLSRMDGQFWKGAIVGIGATLLLTNSTVKNALMGTLGGIFGAFAKETDTPASTPSE